MPARVRAGHGVELLFDVEDPEPVGTPTMRLLLAEGRSAEAVCREHDAQGDDPEIRRWVCGYELAGAEPDGAGLAEAESAAETDSSGGEPSATQVEAAVGPDISEQISRASRRFQGGSDRWDAAVRPLMVMAYDGDGSGWLDTDAELGSVPCQTWDALDRGIRKKWKSGLRQIYGLKPDLLWVGGSLGIHERMRSSADLQVAACGL